MAGAGDQRSARLLPDEDLPVLIRVDGVHPGEWGYYLWADSVRKPILKILKKYKIR